MSSGSPTGDAAGMVHATAHIEPGVAIGVGARIWAHAHVRTGARIGRNCTIGANVFVDLDVVVGDNCKVQNNASLFKGVELADGVFVGPHVIFTNDRVPRAINADGTMKAIADWSPGRTAVAGGAAIGAGAVIVTGVAIGDWAMVGAGAVVTRDVAAHALVVGNPARVVGWVSASGARCDTQREAVELAASELAMSGK